jgi:hypothetical protein
MKRRRLPGNEHVVVRVERLDAVLAREGLPFDFGILSIDAEGMDYQVLLGLNLSEWRPRLIVTEDYAATDKQKAEYLSAHDYQHATQCGDNAVWAKAAVCG